MGGYLLKSALERTLGPFFFFVLPSFLPTVLPSYSELPHCSSIPSPLGGRVVIVV